MPVYDHAGNLVDDGQLIYRYDAWNRLVKVRAKQDDVTIQTAAYDGTGRRIKKVVDNRGDLDATEVYHYDGWKVVEIRDGSNDMDRQFIHGTQYIDEHIMMRAKNKGDLYIHQDANWNVIATTDLGGNVMERYVYEPYGSLTVNQFTSWGDRDGDGDVDATDKGTVGTTCTGPVSGECRILDLDFDGDYDSADAGYFDSLKQGEMKKAGLARSGLAQATTYQGLLASHETRMLHNRLRSYSASLSRFMQFDPYGLRGPAFEPRLQYFDGLNLSIPRRSSPLELADALGLFSFAVCDIHEQCQPQIFESLQFETKLECILEGSRFVAQRNALGFEACYRCDIWDPPPVLWTYIGYQVPYYCGNSPSLHCAAYTVIAVITDQSSVCCTTTCCTRGTGA